MQRRAFFSVLLALGIGRYTGTRAPKATRRTLLLRRARDSAAVEAERGEWHGGVGPSGFEYGPWLLIREVRCPFQMSHDLEIRFDCFFTALGDIRYGEDDLYTHVIRIKYQG
ncbi:hypothetical protein F4811DRAFT_374386 [Daldinia bambusicola]|nr:hypothetical protein F4811DRAFT_374386 [Daldinia bambusicola]